MLGSCEMSISAVLSGSGVGKTSWVTLTHTADVEEHVKEGNPLQRTVDLPLPHAPPKNEWVRQIKASEDLAAALVEIQ